MVVSRRTRGKARIAPKHRNGKSILRLATAVPFPSPGANLPIQMIRLPRSAELFRRFVRLLPILWPATLCASVWGAYNAEGSFHPRPAAHYSIAMGIRFYCPQGHKLNVKSFLAGKKGFCPHCNAKVDIPLRSTRPSSKEDKQNTVQSVMSVPVAGPTSHEGTGSTHDAPLARPVSTPSQGAPMALPISPQALASSSPSLAAPVASTGMAGQTAAPLISKAVPTSGPSPSLAMPQPNAPAGMKGAPSVPAVLSSPTPQPMGTNSTPAAAMSDPIAEAPHAVWYVRPSLGGQYGPASGDMLRQWIQQGRVAADSLVWRDGWPNWQPAASVLPHTGALTPSAGLPDATDLGLPMPLDPLPVSARGALGRTVPRRRSNLVVTIIVVLLVVIALALGGVLIAMLR